MQPLEHGPRSAIQEIMRWALADDNIRAVVLTGSVARGDQDDLSDVDVELYLHDPSDLLNRRNWYNRFGYLLAVEELPNPGWVPTRLLYLVDGKIDFAIGDLASFGASTYSRPFRVLVDKDRRADALAETQQNHEYHPPSAEKFAECLNWFAAAALMQAKLIVRGEPWLAKYRDWDLKGQLLRMMIWDHRCRYGWHYDTWYGGKQVNKWADADVRVALNSCWSGFTEDEMVPALRASMVLFQQLAHRTGVALGYPAFHHDRVREEADRILSARTQK